MSNKIIFLQGYRCNGAQFVMELFKPLYDKLYIKHLAKCMMILYTVHCTVYSIGGYDREKVGRWSMEEVKGWRGPSLYSVQSRLCGCS